MRDAYWMIMYIFLKKSLSIDISDSLLHMGKVRHMLKDVDLSQFSFKNGFLLRVSPFLRSLSGCRRQMKRKESIWHRSVTLGSKKLWIGQSISSVTISITWRMWLGLSLKWVCFLTIHISSASVRKEQTKRFSMQKEHLKTASLLSQRQKVSFVGMDQTLCRLCDRTY